MKDSELVIYGGEYYNGDKVTELILLIVYHWEGLMITDIILFVLNLSLFQTYVYGDLYRYNTEKKEWKLVSSPNSPPPRSAHQSIAWKNSIFVFGITLVFIFDILRVKLFFMNVNVL